MLEDNKMKLSLETNQMTSDVYYNVALYIKNGGVEIEYNVFTLKDELEFQRTYYNGFFTSYQLIRLIIFLSELDYEDLPKSWRDAGYVELPGPDYRGLKLDKFSWFGELEDCYKQLFDKFEVK